jgi:hypothetical protein
MTRTEIAQLKEELAADYKRKLEALELVEQMLGRKPETPSSTSAASRPRAAAGRPSGTVAERVEQAFRTQQKWTIPALMSATGVKHRSSVWATLNRLVKERKIRISTQPSGRRAAEYMRA